jgi:hypothetical protein
MYLRVSTFQFSFLFFSFLFCFAATLYLVLFHSEFNARLRILSQKLPPKNTKTRTN